MGSVNKVILVGNLGRDAELRYTPGGAAVATLNLATTEVWNDKAGQQQEKTEWHRIVLWGKPAESLHRVPDEGQADLRRGPAADAPVGRQGRQQALHHRDPRRPRRAARRRRRRRGSGGGSRRRRGAGHAPAARRRRSRSPTTTFRSEPDSVRLTIRRRAPTFDSVFLSSRPYRSSSRTTSCSSGVDTSKMSLSSIAVMRWMVFGVMWTRSPGSISRFDELVALLDLEQQLARVQVDRLVLQVVVLQAQRVAGVDVDQLADVPIGLRPVQLVAPRLLHSRHISRSRSYSSFADVVHGRPERRRAARARSRRPSPAAGRGAPARAARRSRTSASTCLATRNRARRHAELASARGRRAASAAPDPTPSRRRATPESAAAPPRAAP